jgi:hypothetical protein
MIAFSVVAQTTIVSRRRKPKMLAGNGPVIQLPLASTARLRSVINTSLEKPLGESAATCGLLIPWARKAATRALATGQKLDEELTAK